MGILRKSAAVFLAVLMMFSSFTCLSAFAADDAVYTKITSLSDLTAGDYLITATVDGTTYAVTSNGNDMKPVTVTPSGNSITSPDAAAVFTFAAGSTDGTFTIKGSTGKFINNTTATTGSWADAGVDVTITCTDGNFLLTLPSGRALALYKDNTKIRWYAPSNLGSNGTQSINLYKLGGSAVGPVAEADTIYFTNNNNWSKVYAYMFDDTGLKNAEWPGEEATFVANNDYGQGIYSYKYDANAGYTSIIFTDGTNQTVNIPLTDEFNAYYLTGNGTSKALEVAGYVYGVTPIDTKRTITITSNVDDTAIVEVNVEDSGEYNEGDTVDLIALIYDETYVFAGWYEVIDGVRASTPICEDEIGTYTVGAKDVVLTAYVLKQGEDIDDPVTPVDPTTKDFNKISSLDEVTAGSYVITATYSTDSIEYAFTGEAKMKPAAATVSSGKVVAPTDSMVWEFEDAADGKFYIKNKATGQYIGGATSTTTVYSDTASEPFAVTLNTDGSFRISGTSASTRILALYNNTEGRWYTSAGSYNVKLTFYKLGAAGVTPTTSKIYFTNNNSWSKVYAYMFDDTGLENAEWPGEEATFVANNDYGQGIYGYEYDANAGYTSVIFTDGTNQTVNIPLTDEFNAYYLTGKGTSTTLEVEGYVYGDAPVVTKYTVTVTTNDEDAAIVSDDKSGEYSEGDTVELSVVVETGYVFNGWYLVVDGERVGEALSTEDTFTYTVGTEDVTIQAYVTAEGEDPVVPTPTESFTKITDISEVTAGSYVITATYSTDGAEYALTGEAKMKPAAATVSSGKVVAPTDSMVWEFEDAADGKFYIKNKATGQYIGGTTSTVTVYSDTASEPFAVTLNTDGSFRISGTSASTRILAMYNNTEGRWYTSAGSYNVKLTFYKLGEDKPEPITTTTVYFTKPASWGDTIRVWAWNTEKNNAESFATAPVMTFVETNDYGQNVYSYNLSSEYVNVIFHDGTNQTDTIAVADIFADGNNGVYLDGTKVCYYKYGTAVTKYTVTVTTNDEDAAIVSDDKSGEYSEGDTIELSVVVETGYVFNGWYLVVDGERVGEALSTEETFTYTVGTEDVTIQAYVTAEGEDPVVPSRDYNKIEKLSSVTAGSYVITVTGSDGNTYALTGGTAMAPTTEFTVNGSTITDPEDSMVWVFEASSDGKFYIKNKSTGKYIGWTSGTTVKWDDTKVYDAFVAENTSAAGTFIVTLDFAEGTTDRFIALNVNGTKVEGRLYSTLGSNVNALNFYKLGGTEKPDPETKSIYFTNNNNWSKVYAYMFDDTGLKNAEWPGEEATFVANNDYGQGIYGYEYDANAGYTSVIFTDGTNQTVDIALTDEFNAYYLTGKGTSTTLEVEGYVYGEIPVDTKHTVTITTNVDEDAALVNTDISGEYNEGDTVELTAVVETGYVFNGWYLVVDGVRAETPLSEDETYTYTVGTEDVEIMAYITAEGEDPDVPEAFIKISGADSLAAGSFIITAINDTTEYAFTGGAKMVPTTDFTVTNGTIATAQATDTMTWIFEATEGGYYIKNKATGKYIGWTSGTTVAWDDTATKVFTITANDDGTYTLTLVTNSRKLGLYTSNNAEARLYTTVGQNIVTLNLYKLGKQSTEPTTTSKVYFTKPATWGEKIYIWAWNTEKNIAESFAASPEMTFVETNDYGQNVYSYNLSSEYTNVIFHDGTNQTDTIAVADIFADGNNGVYLDGTKVCYYKYATEVPTYTVIVSSDNENCLVDEDVMNDYEEGAKVTLTVLEYEGYEFLGWYIGSTKLSAQTTYVYTVGTTDVEIVAKFREITTQTYTVIVASDTASCTIEDISDEYAEGTKITLKVLSYTGYNFLGWYVDNECISTATTYEYTVTGDVEILAKFELIDVPEKYIVTVESDTTGCTIADVDGEYEAGTKITLSVTKYDGYKFLGWYIGSTKLSDSTTYEYTVTGYAEIVAKFEALIYVALDVDDASHGKIVGSDELYVEKNTPFTISASALAGYVFAAWTVDGVQVSTSSTYTVAGGVSSAVNYTATFKMLGDFDGNFSITIAEVTKLLNSLSGKAALTASESAVADFNSDGENNLLDAYLMFIKTRA